ncbi:UNVERIFIED_ORG: hypothetical protein J2W38_002099 [Variovorax paradoxus]|nr:hypothetical protein [Variovorax paradoxus]
MAQPARVLAQSQSPSAPIESAIDALARQACDDAAQLQEVLHAHACIEKLIAPERTSDLEGLVTTRSELGALLRLANAELQRCISAVDSTTSRLRQALTAGETNSKPA